jgi:hypothetical protein
MAAFAKSWRREVTGHVGFWGAPEMRPTGEPIQRVLCPERASGAFIGLAYRPWSLTARWKRGTIPPWHE